MNLWLPRGRVGWGGIDWEFGIDMYTLLYLKQTTRDFPGGTVVKNPSANAGDMGSIPGPGRSHLRGTTKPVCHNY